MGVHDTYCVICGITTTGIHWYENDIEYLMDIINAGEFHLPCKSKTYKSRLLKKKQKIIPSLLLNYKKYVADIKKLKSRFKWCDQIYLITNNKVIKNINNLESGDYGSYYNKNESYQTQQFMWDDKNRALICHKSCYKLINNKFNYNLEIDDIENKLNENSLLSDYGETVNKYVGFQDFPWTSMIINNFENFETIMAANKKLIINDNNINFLTDPLKNKKNAERIIKIWNPIIKNLKSKSKLKSKVKSTVKVKLKLKKSRPSPSESATLYKIGEKKKGNDGNIYVVIETKNKVKRWKKLI